jgi:hypothetical protein
MTKPGKDPRDLTDLAREMSLSTGERSYRGADPCDLTADALRLATGSGEDVYQSKMQSARRLRADGFSDEEIERILVIKLKPQDRASS